MTERRLRDLRRRRAMRICDRPERRIAEWSGVDESDRFIGQRVRVLGGHFHEEVVRVLRVDDRTSADRLAGLKELRIFLPDRQRLETQHRTKHEMTASERAIGHAHHPVRRKQLIAAARP